MDNNFKLDLKELINFFDYKPTSSHKHSSMLVSLFGENLALQMIKHYFTHSKENGGEVLAIHTVCTPGTKKGKRLDGWILVNPKNAKDKIIFYQTEIKNVSSHSWSYSALLPAATEEELKTKRKERFFKFLGDASKEGIWKVLNRMKRPELPDGFKDFEIRPLLCLWDGVHHKGEAEPFYKYPFPPRFADSFVDKERKDFKEFCWIFSMSTYARELLKNGKTINVELEHVSERLDWVNRILKK